MLKMFLLLVVAMLNGCYQVDDSHPGKEDIEEMRDLEEQRSEKNGKLFGDLEWKMDSSSQEKKDK